MINSLKCIGVKQIPVILKRTAYKMTSYMDKLKTNLEALQSVDYTDEKEARVINAKAHNALLYIFYVETANRRPSDAEKKMIADYLVKALKPIKIHVEGLSYEYFKKLKVSILMKRSAVQFLVDRYSDMDVASANCKLSKIFADNHLEESAEILDEIISSNKDSHDSDDPDSEREETNIPPEHNWWD